MSALPDDDPVADRPVAPPAAETEETDGELRNLYVIPQVEVEPAGPGRLQKALGELQPPQFWNEATPSPAEELNRARHGRHLQATGPLRKAAVAYAVVAGVLNVRSKAAIWVRSHPMRALTVLAVLGALLLTPARPVVAYALFGLGHWAFELLID